MARSEWKGPKETNGPELGRESSVLSLEAHPHTWAPCCFLEHAGKLDVLAAIDEEEREPWVAIRGLSGTCFLTSNKDLLLCQTLFP